MLKKRGDVREKTGIIAEKGGGVRRRRVPEVRDASTNGRGGGGEGGGIREEVRGCLGHRASSPTRSTGEDFFSTCQP